MHLSSYGTVIVVYSVLFINLYLYVYGSFKYAVYDIIFFTLFLINSTVYVIGKIMYVRLFAYNIVHHYKSLITILYTVTIIALY